jgi:hypothetical protein
MSWIRRWKVQTISLILSLLWLISSYSVSLGDVNVKAISAIRSAMRSLSLDADLDVGGRRVIFHIGIAIPSPSEDVRWGLDLYSTEGELIKRFEGQGEPGATITWPITEELGGCLIYQFSLSLGEVDLSSTPRAILIPSRPLLTKLPRFHLQAHPREISGDVSVLLLVTPLDRESSIAGLKLSVMDGEGKMVWEKKLGGDSRLVEWDGRDSRGRMVKPGPYACAIRAGDLILSNFLLLSVHQIERESSFFSASVEFNPGSAKLTSRGGTRLEEVSSFIRSHPGVAVKLKVGLPAGDPIEAMELLARRIKVIMGYLAKPDTLSTEAIRIAGCIQREDVIRVDLIPIRH